MSKIAEFRKFVEHDIWRILLEKEPPRRSFWLKQARIVLLALKEFSRNDCGLRASALTFFTLLSIVPIFALAFAFAKGFGLDKKLEEQLAGALVGHEAILEKVLTFSRNMLEDAKGGVIAGVGIVVLVWTVIKVLGNIESSFNHIWGIRKARTLFRKLTDYLFFMFISPILFASASSINVFIASQVHGVAERFSFLGPVAQGGLRLLPLLLIWVLFTFTYKFIPNGKVAFRSALLGGIVAGTVYQVTQWIYVTFQVGVAQQGAIYGSFAALPLFLGWLQLSWLIVLFGAEVSFAHQNVATYEFEDDCRNASVSFRRRAALCLVQRVADAFRSGRPAPTSEELRRELEAPVRLVNHLVDELVQARVLSEVRRDNEETIGYQPATDLEALTVMEVITRLDSVGVSSIPLAESDSIKSVNEALERFRASASGLEANRSFKTL